MAYLECGSCGKPLEEDEYCICSVAFVKQPPCPECEKHKAVWDNLKTNMEADVKILREQLEKARRGSVFIDSLDAIAAKAFILTVYLNLMKEKEAGDDD